MKEKLCIRHFGRYTDIWDSKALYLALNTSLLNWIKLKNFPSTYFIIASLNKQGIGRDLLEFGQTIKT